MNTARQQYKHTLAIISRAERLGRADRDMAEAARAEALVQYMRAADEEERRRRRIQEARNLARYDAEVAQAGGWCAGARGGAEIVRKLNPARFTAMSGKYEEVR